MDYLQENNIPWELITQSLAGALTRDEELRLQQWISEDPAHKQYFDQLKELWSSGVRDYNVYKNANEESSWKNLQSKLKVENHEEKYKLTSKRIFMRRIASVAAVFLGLIAIGVMVFLSGRSSQVYETLSDAEKEVMLKDGSVIRLKPLTRIEVLGTYGKNERTVKMTSGEAFFEVVHHEGNSFIVDLGETQVKDIGTSFTIQKNKRKIQVSVITGEVEFSNLATKDVRALSAGKRVDYDVKRESFGEIETIHGSSVNSLIFSETPLPDVVEAIRNTFHVKIQIEDADISNLKLTAHLEGKPFVSVMEVLCETLGLEYSLRGNTYIIKEKN